MERAGAIVKVPTMDSIDFTTVLGNPRVLSGSQADARTRVLAYDGDVIVGIAMFEPLYGHHAEAVIAVASGSPSGLITLLFDNLVDLARSYGITVLRYALGPGSQRSLASRLRQSCSATTLRPDRLELRLQYDDSAGGRRLPNPDREPVVPEPRAINQAVS